MKVQIEKLQPNLEGEVTAGSRKYSVPFVVPGDIVEIKIQKKKVEVLSIERNESFPYLEESQCRYFGLCGGCKAQHLQYPYQWKVKTQELQRLYEDMEVQVTHVLPRKIYYYRNRMDFVVDKDRVGLRKLRDFQTIVDIDECKIQKPESNTILQTFKKILKKYPETGYDRASGQGIIKYLTIRSDVTVAVILTVLDPVFWKEEYRRNYQEFVSTLKENLQTLQNTIQKEISLQECYVDTFSEVSNTGRGKVLSGNEYFEARFGNLLFSVPHDAFFQPNPSVIKELVDQGILFLQKHDIRNRVSGILDVFCGVGTLSLYMFSKLKQDISINFITGIDITGSAIKQANLNAKQLFGNFADKYIRFHEKNLLKKLDLDIPDGTLLILDPPRSSLHPHLIRWIVRNRNKIPVIFYLSCNPAAQYQELRHFQDDYDVAYVSLGDPFPHTPHFESLLILIRKTRHRNTDTTTKKDNP